MIFVCLFTVKVCDAKREKLMNFLVSSMKQEYRVLNILFLLVSLQQNIGVSRQANAACQS